ncbi:SDR family NAD(P)-dependent oxidoreductase [Herbaspirillum autotrophicum]|uniref:SDR family NAD(P)-dependent oxidoreductase n=1 Tax=Herbaspirillum autotrophicum TaxID=180195 RepID=UPI0018DEAE1F|nr:SDR family oxidoreductase [Herbaspirillum autotrophicum]
MTHINVFERLTVHRNKININDEVSVLSKNRCASTEITQRPDRGGDLGTRYSGKTVLVTGAGRGIGRAIAEAFADEGAAVVVSARTQSHGNAAVAAILARGGKASLVGGDISDPEAVKAMFEQAVSRHGGVDIVVSCAADNGHGLVLDMPEKDYDYLVKSNIHAPFWIARAAAPHLSKAQDKGRLIFISSATANRTYMPGIIPYIASKAYLNAFARGLALELGQQNILVNVVEPGMIASDRMKDKVSDEQAAQIAQNFPVPRPGLPADIASAVLYLASPEASYMTGSSMLVDGGVSMVALTGMSDKLTKR